MPRRVALLCVLSLAGVLVPRTVGAQQHHIEDPVPPNARGAVLPIAGEVRTIQGLSSIVAGHGEALASALATLRATTTPTEIRIEMSADVLFDFDQANIKAEANPALEQVLTVLASYPQAPVTIEGYTDARGGDAYNQKLSERRAEAVRRWLASRPAGRAIQFSTRGLGAQNPVAPNRKPDGSDDPAGRQKNRRVEIVVRKH
jgi:outer membrane protein OmpA-like peptidoglycan-associated protein